MNPTIRVAAIAAALFISISSVEAAPQIVCNERGCSDWIGVSNNKIKQPQIYHTQIKRQTVKLQKVYSTQIDIRALTPNERMDYYTKNNTNNSYTSPSSRNAPIRSYETYERAYAGGAQIIGGMPSECERWVPRIPSIRYLFCGCGVAAKVGLDNTDGFWNVARNFYTLPRAAPSPGMVAVTNRHVFVLERHVEGNTWIIYNPNGAGHKTWRQPYSIVGWTIVNPNGHVRKIKQATL